MVIGFAWAIVWFLFFRDDPKDAHWLSDTEREFIFANRQHSTSPTTESSIHSPTRGSQQQPSSLHRALFRSRTVWALCGQYFASNFVFFFGLTWFFPELKARYGLTGLEASLFAAVPMIFGALGNWTSGWWVDRMFSAGRWQVSRRLPAMIGFLLASAGILGSAYAATPLTSSFWFSLCIFGSDMTLSPSWSTCVDIGKSNAGVVSGTMNMAGNFGSFLTALAFPYLLVWTGSSMPFFFIAAAMNIVSIGLWILIEPTVALTENAS